MELKLLQKILCQSIQSNPEQNNFEEIKHLLVGAGDLSLADAIDVYSSDYKARMREALSKNYEATWLVMGDDDFFKIADLYIQSHPSSYKNLTAYGESFPLFISKQKDLEDASKMASFEQTFWSLFHSKDQKKLFLDEKKIITGEFNLENIKCIESDLRLDLLWKHRESSLQGNSDILEQLEIFEKTYLILFKAEDKVEVLKVSEASFAIIMELKDCKKITLLQEREVSNEVWKEVFEIILFSEINHV
jgi:hypothetical protein